MLPLPEDREILLRMADELRAFLDWHHPLVSGWTVLTRAWPSDVDARKRWLASNYSRLAMYKELLDNFAAPGPSLSLSHRYIDNSHFTGEAGEVDPKAFGRWLDRQRDAPAMLNGMLRPVQRLLDTVMDALTAPPAECPTNTAARAKARRGPGRPRGKGDGLTPGSKALAAAVELRKEGRPVSLKAACGHAGVDRKNVRLNYPDAVRAIEALATPDRTPRRGTRDRRTGAVDGVDDGDE